MCNIFIFNKYTDYIKKIMLLQFQLLIKSYVKIKYLELIYLIIRKKKKSSAKYRLKSDKKLENGENG